MGFYFPLISGNTGDRREHLVRITWQFISNFPSNPPFGRDLESWRKSFVACDLFSFQEDSVFLSAEIAAVTTNPGRVGLPGSYADGVFERFFR
jgi:hypothetical protein